MLNPLFVGSIFIGAFLLFLVQPLAARMLLPRYGGSPAVWNTALVFFQTMLLLGYLYAHWLARAVPGRRQLAVHLPVLALPLLLLPPVVPEVLRGMDGPPALSVLVILAVLVGGPFFVLSTNSSLVQYWCARSGSAGSDDPYWLYGASNLGSLLALVAYPFIVEPAFDLGFQGVLWSGGYGVFVVVTGVAVVAAHRASGTGFAVEGAPTRGSAQPAPATPPRVPEAVEGVALPEPEDAGEPAAPEAPHSVTALRRALWVTRAAVGTSLLLAVTMRITTDVASVPLFWIVPLALYLVTFIVAFSFTDRLPRKPVAAAAVLGLASAAGLLLGSHRLPLGLVIVVNLAVLFFGALLCHRDLAADRPHPRHLTSFYLWISFGGALGGVLNSLVAPVVFDSVAEYPLTLIALAALLHVSPDGRRPFTAFRPSLPVGLLASAALVLPLGTQRPDLWTVATWYVLVAFAFLWGLALSRYVGFLALSIVAVTVIHHVGTSSPTGTVAMERSFFGVVRIELDGDVVKMIHGTTIHGTQYLDPGLRGRASGYYHAETPMGTALRQLPPGARVGVLGLGAGALAAHLEPGQEMVYHEIDPLVVEMARAHFTYLEDARGEVEVVLGDGRLTLEDVPDGSYDLLVVDAFSSDFVPTHLLTVEALELYRRKVRPGGLVLLHISNRHADLARVVKGYSEATGQPVAHVDHGPSAAALEEGAFRSQVAALAPDPETVAELRTRPGWGYIDIDVRPVVWTDSRIDLPAVLW